MGRKSEVYTWRVTPAMKARLEETARHTGRSVARLLDDLVAEGIETIGTGEAELEEQRRLHARAATFAGRFSGTDPGRSERARDGIRARLAGRRGRVR
jgi:predicted DNA-binding protein